MLLRLLVTVFMFGVCGWVTARVVSPHGMRHVNNVVYRNLQTPGGVHVSSEEEEMIPSVQQTRNEQMIPEVLVDDIDKLMDVNELRYFKSCIRLCSVLNYSQPSFDLAQPEPIEFYVSTVKSLPPSRLMPTIGNGHIASVVDSSFILMNGLYNGREYKSHRARIPSVIAFNIQVQTDEKVEREYSMDYGNGLWKETLRGEDFIIEKTSYAHRSLDRIIIVEVDVLRIAKSGEQENLNILLQPQSGNTDDLVLKNEECSFMNCEHLHGQIVDPETSTSPKLEVHIFYNPLMNVTIEAPREKAERQKHYFYASISPDISDALVSFVQAREWIETNQLLSRHVNAWRQIWAQSTITVKGNPVMQRAINSAMYYIFCSLPQKNDSVSPFIGLSPTDLGHGTSAGNGDDNWDYQAHIFWDQEIWTMPFLTIFRPDLSEILLSTRVRTAESAFENAKKNGFRGAQYPWESAYTGVEVTPGKVYGQNEVHITGDVSLAWLKHALATGDRELFTRTDYRNVLLGAAQFWNSRLVWDDRKRKYVITHVMPPDEYHQDVNNSAYTNLIARISMQAPHKILTFLGLESDGKTLELHDKANEIYQPFDEINQYHPEYDTYKIGTKIKQADVILMNYPLNEEMSNLVRKRDLEIYENVTDEDGPAMTFAMFAIGYASIGELEKVHENVNKTLKHVKDPFSVWTENRDGSGAVSFITGAGGFLQSIVNGYAGIRIRETCLEINPSLPFQVSEFILDGLKYFNNSFQIMVKSDTLTILQKKNSSEKFKVEFEATEKRVVPGVKLVMPRGKVSLFIIRNRYENSKTVVWRRRAMNRRAEWEDFMQSVSQRL